MTNIYIESIFMAWGSILSNKMRSLLTMLGIIIGVAAVIALMSIGYGVQSDIENNISSLGSNTITVTPGTGRKPGIRPAAGSMQTLTYKDYLAIRNLPNISYAAPLVNTSYLVVNGNKNWTTRIYGCTEDYATLSSLSVSEGRFWTDKEYNARAGVHHRQDRGHQPFRRRIAYRTESPHQRQSIHCHWRTGGKRLFFHGPG